MRKFLKNSSDASMRPGKRLITCPEIVYNDVRAGLLERLLEVPTT